MLHDRNHKFHTLWGRYAWVNRDPGAEACWSYNSNYFEDALKPEECNVNWLEGASGGQWDRPQFAADAPALLGFDETIWDYCSEVAQQGNWGGGDWNKELARRCVLANQNILRLMFSCADCTGSRAGWNMCRNLQWVTCAARGMLPSQGPSRAMHFAKAPRELDTRDLDDPGRTGSWWTEPHWNHYAVSDVFFAEVCLLSALCKNSWELFTVQRGEPFVCEYEDARYRTLVAALKGGLE